MKIYTRVEMDMASGAVTHEESFEYEGPVVLCGGGGGGGGKGGSAPSPPPTPAKPATGREATAATTEAVDEQQRRVKASLGQQGTILTSPLGAQATNQQGKTLLGM